MSTQSYQTGYWDYTVQNSDTVAYIGEEQKLLQRMGKDGWEHYFVENISNSVKRHYFKKFIKTPPQKKSGGKA